ncbi:MAG: CHASE domain-containing protein, partial [Candidatus Hydrogenedentes bacterium]|nr:CHASE domain-containing protein [Candidatus Hydrogenedentota bacterium]
MRQNRTLITAVCVGVVLTAAAFAATWQWENKRIDDDLRVAAEDQVFALERTLDRHAMVLKALEGFYTASQDVTREEFDRISQPFLARHPGIRLLEWIPRMRRLHWESPEKIAQEEGKPALDLTGEVSGPTRVGVLDEQYFPVFYVAPIEGNGWRLFRDLASEPVQLASLNQARDTGEPTATARIRIASGEMEQLGFQTFQPIYAKGKQHDTLVERRKYLAGYVSAVQEVGDLVRDALAGLGRSEIEIHLFDMSAPPEERFLCYYPWPGFVAPTKEKVDEATLRSGVHHAMEIALADREWLAVATPTHRFVVARRTWLPWVVLVVALLLNGLLAVYLVGRERAQMSLQESEEQLALALRGADLGVWDWNISTGETTFNDRWAEMLGYRVEEIDPQIRSRMNLLHPDDAPYVDRAMQAHLLGETEFYETEHRMRHRSGKWIWVLDRGRVISRDRNNKPLRACGTHLDITERRRGEEEIARMRRYLQNVINSMPSTLIGVDIEGIVTHWNQEAERVTGLSASEAEGRFFHDAYPLLERIADRVKKAVRDGVPLVSERLQTEGEDEEIAYRDVIVYPLEEGGAVGAVIRVDEVTSRVKIEEMMVQTEKMMSVGGLAAGMAHEINNPIAVIQGNLDVIHQELDITAEGLETEFNLIYEQIHSVNILISKLLQFARPEEFVG